MGERIISIKRRIDLEAEGKTEHERRDNSTMSARDFLLLCLALVVGAGIVFLLFPFIKHFVLN